MVLVRWIVALLLMCGGSAFAGDAPQMPRDLPLPAPVPQMAPQEAPPVMPQTLPQMPPGRPALPSAPMPDYMLDCRSNWTTVVFLVHPVDGVVEVVSSFPQWQGALYESPSEYVLAFRTPRVLEFVISRYTGRMTAVEDGVTVLGTGVCRKRLARTLF